MMEAVCYQFVITQQLTVMNWLKLQIYYPSVYTEIHINYLLAEFNQTLIDLKQKFRNSSTNSNVVGAG